MRLNRDLDLIMRYSKEGVAKVAELVRLLPDAGCVKLPSVLVALFEGKYYVVKSRWDLLGDDLPRGVVPVDPYTLDFKEYTLKELRSVCNPSTGYAMPDGFAGSCVLVTVK